MNWLTKFVKPIIKKLPGGKKSLDVAENSWIKCTQCQSMLYADDLEKIIHVCPNCDNHLQVHPKIRLKYLFDGGVYEEIKYPANFSDPLGFKDSRTYKERFYEAQEKTGLDDSFLIGSGKINGLATTVAAMSFDFMGGSCGAAGSEAMVKAAEHAVTHDTPLVVFTCSGGMRMQENQYSLQALPKTTIAVQMVKDAKLPYIVVLTNPTSGGVSASFGMLGDVTLAEPNALICFAGPRVISNTVGETLPDGFQRSEYLFDNGFIDQIVHRKDIKDKLLQILSLLLKRAA
jgi:acetyl-CoA carboxylase carboxyl transferase subunit beta